MIYVMSDIHGNIERFHSMLKQIKLKEQDTLFILGDVIDRGPDGIKILEEIIDAKNIKMLLGNHEYMMLKALDSCDSISNRYEALWLNNGGAPTLESALSLEEERLEKILNFLRELPINLDIKVNKKKYKLVHGSPIEMYGDPRRYRSEVEYSVFNRIKYELFLKDCTVIFGHTTTNHYQNNYPMKIFHGESIIGIDCGAGYPKGNKEGRLACLRLNDNKEFYSKN